MPVFIDGERDTLINAAKITKLVSRGGRGRYFDAYDVRGNYLGAVSKFDIEYGGQTIPNTTSARLLNFARDLEDRVVHTFLPIIGWRSVSGLAHPVCFEDLHAEVWCIEYEGRYIFPFDCECTTLEMAISHADETMKRKHAMRLAMAAKEAAKAAD